MNKKGQMEMIGFMVIILLLFFGLLLYFRFSADTGSDFIREAEENLEVSNLMSAIRLYTVCEDTQLGDVIKTCIDDGTECSESACDIVQREVPQIISLYGWDNQSYMFFIGEERYSPNECRGNTFVDDYTTSNTKVRLVYCYS